MLFRYENDLFSIDAMEVNGVAKAAMARKSYFDGRYLDSYRKRAVQSRFYKSRYQPEQFPYPSRRNPRAFHDFAPKAKATLKCRVMAACRTLAIRMESNTLSKHGRAHLIRAIARLFLRAMPHLRIDPENPDTHISFIGQGNKNDPKKRRSLTIGRYIARHCKSLVKYCDLSDDDIVKFANNFREFRYIGDIKLVSGRDATDIYAKHGSQIHSCMSGEDQRYIMKHHFEANPDKLQLVTYWMDGKLSIRAKLFHQDDGTYFLDRIYVNYSKIDFDAIVIKPIIEHELTKLGVELAGLNRITLNHTRGEPMPYLDKVRSFDRENDTIILHSCGEYSACCTAGTDESCQRRCSCCGGCVDAEDIQESPDGNDICEGCFDNRCYIDDITSETIWFDDSVELHDGERTHIDNTALLCSSFYGRCVYAVSDDVCETYDNDTILSEDAVSYTHPTYNGHQHHCDDSEVVETSNGTLPAYKATEIDGNWYADCDFVELADGSRWPQELCDMVEFPDNYGNIVQMWVRSDYECEVPDDVLMM